MITVNPQFTLMSVLRLLPLPVVIYLALILLPVRFMVGPLQFTGLRFYLLLMLVPLIAAAMRRAPILPDLLLPIFVLWAGVCMFVNTPGQVAEHTGAIFLELVGGYLLARTYITNAAQFGAFIRALATLVIFCLPLALYEAASGAAPVIELIRAIPGIYSVDVVNIAPRLGLERAQVVFAHPIHFGLFCSAAVSLFFVGLSRDLSLITRVAGLVLIVLTAFLALSSGAFIAVLVQLFLIAWALFFRQTRHRWWLLLASIGVAYVAVDLISNRTPLRVFMSYATFSAHNAYWRGLIFEWGMVNIGQNPVFGLGLEDWERPHFMYSGSMDNFWLTLGVRYGVPGFLLLTLAWICGIFRVARATAADPTLRRAWMFCLLGLSFTLATVHIWTAIYSFSFFLLGAGQWMTRRRASSTQTLPTGFTRPHQLGFQRTKGVAA